MVSREGLALLAVGLMVTGAIVVMARWQSRPAPAPIAPEPPAPAREVAAPEVAPPVAAPDDSWRLRYAQSRERLDREARQREVDAARRRKAELRRARAIPRKRPKVVEAAEPVEAEGQAAVETRTVVVRRPRPTAGPSWTGADTETMTIDDAVTRVLRSEREVVLFYFYDTA